MASAFLSIDGDVKRQALSWRRMNRVPKANTMDLPYMPGESLQRYLHSGSVALRSDQLDGPVIIAMISMWMMETTIHNVVDMISMRHSLMLTAWTVNVVRIMTCAYVIRCALIWIFLGHLQTVFIDVVTMHMVKMSIVYVIDMVTMSDGSVPTIRSVDVGMVWMDLAGCLSVAHQDSLFI